MDGLMEQLSRMATNPSTPSSDSSGGGLKALLRGLDPDALKDFDPRQVEHLWKHMDELASRPEEYRAFVRSQAAHAGFDPSKLPPSVRAAADKQGSKGPQAQAKGGKAPAPIMAYLRMTGAPGGDDLLASPDACIALKRASGAAAAALAPRYANGRPFAEADTDLRGLQVPLGMRRPPRMQASSHAGNLGKEETMFDVECHPTAVAAAMAQPEGFRRYLIQAAVQFLQRKFGIKLGEATRILVATQELLAGELQASLAQRREAALRQAASGTAAASLSPSLLGQLSSLGSAAPAHQQLQGTGTPASPSADATSTARKNGSLSSKAPQSGGAVSIQRQAPAAGAASEPAKRPLIQELDVTASSGNAVAADSAEADGQNAAPAFNLTECRSEDGRISHLQLVVELPGVLSASEVELDIQGRQLALSAMAALGRQALLVHLPCLVDTAKSKAKLDKKHQRLVVRLYPA